jgi:hypothetical protein
MGLNSEGRKVPAKRALQAVVVVVEARIDVMCLFVY